MTRRNEKRNNRRNSRQRNNNPELPPFAQVLFGAIVGKGAKKMAEIARKMAEIAEEETHDIHAEGISNQEVTNINNGKATLFTLRIPADGSAVEYHIPDNLQFFFAEDGKLMVRQKIERYENPTDAGEGKPITYDDICKKMFLGKRIFFINGKGIEFTKAHDDNYDDVDNSTSSAQARRMAAFNKLQNIAKYLNNGWQPNFTDARQNWYISKKRNGEYKAMFSYSDNFGAVFFKSKCLVNEAIRLMGEDYLNDLFSTDW